MRIRIPKRYLYTESIYGLSKQEIKSNETFAEVLKREEHKLENRKERV